jgi:isoleucyl-tRNA synthetase
VQSKHVLDRWIVARFEKLASESSAQLDQYKVLEPARAIRDFIADLSQWYIRLSRNRFKSNDTEDKQAALATTRFILLELSKLIAPFMPFLAEDIYIKMRGDKESVHLEEWPTFGRIDEKILANMEAIRTDVSLGLEARARAGIKVRQPLASVSLKSKDTYEAELLELLRDELNVKEVFFNPKQENVVVIDTTITDELKKEGVARDLIRFVQEMRKKAGLSPDDAITLTIHSDTDGQEIVRTFESEIKKVTGSKEISLAETDGEVLALDPLSFTVHIER